MRQIWITKTGDPEVLITKEAPTPIPKSGELRIIVEATSINAVDILSRQGRYPSAPPIPFVPGHEVAGTIDAVGQGISGFKEGDKVFAYTNFGGYSDLVCVPHVQVFKRLDWMSAKDGAALLVDYLSAYIVLVVIGSLHKKDRVFIHYANECLGLAVLNICRILGASVYGTALNDYHDFLQENGLIRPIDWRDQDFEQAVNDITEGQGMDIVIAHYDVHNWEKNYRILAAAGRLIYIEGTSLEHKRANNLSNRLRALFTRPTFTASSLLADNKSVGGFNLGDLWQKNNKIQNWVDQIITWYDEALFRPLIDRVFPFSQAAKAHAYVQNKENRGKVILIPD